MSHLKESCYTNKLETIKETKNYKKETCIYELKNGGYLVCISLYEKKENEDGDSSYSYFIETDCTCYCTVEKPDSMEKENNMNKLIEYGKKQL